MYDLDHRELWDFEILFPLLHLLHFMGKDIYIFYLEQCVEIARLQNVDDLFKVICIKK
jgi:hypothetical protein